MKPLRSVGSFQTARLDVMDYILGQGAYCRFGIVQTSLKRRQRR